MQNKPESILSIWGKTLYGYPKTFLTLLPIILLIILIYLLPQILIDFSNLSAHFNAKLIHTLGSILFHFMAIWLYAVAILKTNSLIKQEPLNYAQAMKSGLKRYFQLFLANIAVVFLCALSMLLFIIPGIIVSVFILFYQYVILLENDKASTSIANSFKLVSHNFWRTFVVAYIPFMLLILTVLWIKLDVDSSMTTLQQIIVTKYFLEPALFLILIPLGIPLLTHQYYDLKLRKKIPQKSSNIALSFWQWFWRAFIFIFVTFICYELLTIFIDDLSSYIGNFALTLSVIFKILLGIGILLAIILPIFMVNKLQKRQAIAITFDKPVILFRSLIFIHIIIGVLSFISLALFHKHAPSQALTYFNWRIDYVDAHASFFAHLLSATSEIFGIVNMIALAGIFILNSKSRYVYIVALLGWLLTAYGQVPYIYSGFAAALGCLDYLMIGIFTAMMFSSPLKAYFTRK